MINETVIITTNIGNFLSIVDIMSDFPSTCIEILIMPFKKNIDSLEHIIPRVLRRVVILFNNN